MPRQAGPVGQRVAIAGVCLLAVLAGLFGGAPARAHQAAAIAEHDDSSPSASFDPADATGGFGLRMGDGLR